MNRISFNRLTPATENPLFWPDKQLRKETEHMLRDMAYVLQLTHRVKEQLLEEKVETVGT